jgi:hypothetical protein
MITGAQIRQGRELLGWRQAELAKKAKVETPSGTVTAFFEDRGPRTGTDRSAHRYRRSAYRYRLLGFGLRRLPAGELFRRQVAGQIAHGEAVLPSCVGELAA